MTDIEQILNENLAPLQRDAAMDPSREVLCLACAGSGKSRTLAFRIARLVAEGENPSSIVAFTFTDKAAESIKRQVAKALDAAGLDPMCLGAMYIGTIHSYCNDILGEMDAQYRQFDVLDENRLKLFLISRYYELNLHQIQRDRGARYFKTVKEISEAWKIMNDEMIEVAEIAEHDTLLGSILEGIAARLNQDQFIDFSLMIHLVVEALENETPGALRAVSGLRHLMVDEYQDINPAQERLIKALHRMSSTLFVVGDDDQAIYSWRGADVNNILTFKKRYPGCSPHTLSHNYRSTPAIVKAADDFAGAELGASREPKSPTASEPIGSKDFRKLWFENRDQEAQWVSQRIDSLLGAAYPEIKNGVVKIRGLTQGDFAVLMRSTRVSEGNGSPRHFAFSQALDARGIDYTLEAGGGVFDRAQVSILRDAFELLRDGSPDRDTAREFFDNAAISAFPDANFDRFAKVLTQWGRSIHTPPGGARQRVYPQKLVHELLNAFGIDRSDFDSGIMHDIGTFSRILQDVESVYVSVDSAGRFRDILNFLSNVAETGYDTGTDDILLKPDAVTISTVHKMKGLEFPVVFVVDVEAQRFPGKKRNYSGWLPKEVIQPAIDRNAYISTPDEEARLFYTAVTRAERYLYVTGSKRLPGGADERKPSRFSLRLNHSEISDNSTTLPEGLSRSDPAPRIEEVVVPTSYSDINYYLRCPKDYQFRKSFGFSPRIEEMFGYGKTAHTVICKLHEIYADRAPNETEVERVSRSTFHLKHVPRSSEPETRPGAFENASESVCRIAKKYAERYSADFAREKQVEARFEIPIEKALISGSIDLLLRRDDNGRILDSTIIDFKAMEGTEDLKENEKLYWTELALQVQLYAKAANEVLGENARTGAVHLLKDNQRVEIPVTDDAIHAAVSNVEWAVDRILANDFPMRPHKTKKCNACDFNSLCPKIPEDFKISQYPPEIHLPSEIGIKMTRAFSEFESIH